MRTPYEATARHVCEDVLLWPLEVVYDYDAFAGPGEWVFDRGRSGVDLALSRVPADRRRPDRCGHRLHAAGEANRPWPGRLGLKIFTFKNDGVEHAHTLSFKDGWWSVASPAPASLGSPRLSLRVHRQTWPTPPPPSPPTPPGMLRVHSSDLELGKVSAP